jgi:hypothetical protein
MPTRDEVRAAEPDLAALLMTVDDACRRFVSDGDSGPLSRLVDAGSATAWGASILYASALGLGVTGALDAALAALSADVAATS